MYVIIFFGTFFVQKYKQKWKMKKEKRYYIFFLPIFVVFWSLLTSPSTSENYEWHHRYTHQGWSVESSMKHCWKALLPSDGRSFLTSCGHQSVKSRVCRSSIRDSVCPVLGMFGKTDAFFVVRAHLNLCHSQLSTSLTNLSANPFRSQPYLIYIDTRFFAYIKEFVHKTIIVHGLFFGKSSFSGQQ